MKLYNQEDKDFCFSAWPKACQQLNVDGVKRGKNLLLCQNDLPQYRVLDANGKVFTVAAESLGFNSNSSLEVQQVFTATIQYETLLHPQDATIDYLLLCQHLLQAQYQWFLQFFNWIHAYLSQRVSQGKTLVTHDVMRINLATVIEDLQLLETLLQEEPCIESLTGLNSILKRGIKRLANCTGGRSFTGGNLLEQLWFISLFNHFLLSQGEL
jgi:hypothetical protein